MLAILLPLCFSVTSMVSTVTISFDFSVIWLFFSSRDLNCQSMSPSEITPAKEISLPGSLTFPPSLEALGEREEEKTSERSCAGGIWNVALYFSWVKNVLSPSVLVKSSWSILFFYNLTDNLACVAVIFFQARWHGCAWKNWWARNRLERGRSIRGFSCLSASEAFRWSCPFGEWLRRRLLI